MVNKAVYNILKNDATLTALTSSIFPTVMPEGTNAPCVVFFRDSLAPEYDKSGNVIDTSEVSVLVFAKDYPDAVELISAVRDALELVKGVYNGVNVLTSRVIKGEEGYDSESDTFYQRLTFRIRTSKL